jgi:2'-5' RNA ligase
MIEKQNLYFIALIPQRQVYEEVTGFKKDFATRFSSTKALKVMPHITLKAPFKLISSGHARLMQWFQRLNINLPPFDIELNNFGAFPDAEKPVVFVHPVINTSLYSLQKEIITGFKNAYPEQLHRVDVKFKPHMTIAYRDLDPGNFQSAWREYKSKEYKAVFEVQSFFLLQHDTKKWNVINTYLL